MMNKELTMTVILVDSYSIAEVVIDSIIITCGILLCLLLLETCYKFRELEDDDDIDGVKDETKSILNP
jgi:hypothetical protein